MTEGGKTRRSAFGEFKSWHRDPALYRQIYAQVVATVVAGLVLYLIAAATGLVQREPAAALGLVGGFAGLGFSWFGVVLYVRARRELSKWAESGGEGEPPGLPGDLRGVPLLVIVCSIVIYHSGVYLFSGTG